VNLDWATHPVWLIINALAAYRLTRLWVADMLPPLPRMRDAVESWALQRWGAYRRTFEPLVDDHEPTAEDARDVRLYGGIAPLAYLVTCAWCSGYWISLLVFLAASLVPATAWTLLAVPLAFSAVVGLLHQATE
jgi:hypothetical protein